MTSTDESMLDDLDKQAAHHRIPGGQVGWLRNGQKLQWSYGIRDVDSGDSVGSTTPFPIGSLSKPWVAAMAMILANDEGLHPDDPLDEFFPGTAFSLRQLLSHNAGFPTHLQGPGSTPSEWARFAVRPEVLAKPGRWSAYSSAGIVTAAALVEHLSGMSWFEATREFLAEPLGINLGLARDRSDSARGHLARSDGGWACVEPVTHPAVEDAAGGLALSAAGMIAFIEAGLAGAGPFSLPDEQREALVTDQVCTVEQPEDVGRRWSAWSLQVVGEPDSGQLILDCFLDGIVANLRCVPHTGEVLTMFTNGDQGDKLWRDTHDLLGGKEADQATGVVGEPALPIVAVPEEALGVFADGTDVVEVARDGGETHLQLDGFTLARMDWHENGRFTLMHPSRGSLGRGGYLRMSDGEEVLFLAGRVARRGK
ncbi:serine hydrolase domain-containing protein [Kocuria carniphila]|uniref:Serine hydrolase domain-containing protein n=1 Tax=Kocuria carniphila TaxID=262208 RepID=A0ABV3V861_9MICC